MAQHTPILDGASVAVVMATLAGWLPPIASAFAVVWYMVLIYEWWQVRQGRAATKLLPEFIKARHERHAEPNPGPGPED